MAKDSGGLIGEGQAAQCGALCWRQHRARIEVLLVTSRDTGRWVIPKGWPIEGLSPAEAATREAWEEAGVTGSIDATGLGTYFYLKAMNRRTKMLPCIVQVFALRVSKTANKFPERKERRRKWFAAHKAAKLVLEPGLAEMIMNFAPPASIEKPAAKTSLADR